MSLSTVKCKYQQWRHEEEMCKPRSILDLYHPALSLWLNVFSRTLCLLLLCAHIYSGTLQQGGTNWTPDEIGSASYTDQLDKAKPAWPLNKHLQLLFGLWAPSWTPSMEGKQCTHTSPSRPHTTCRCTALHSWGGVCHDKLSLWHVCESGPHRWRVYSCIGMCLNPMGSLYFCFLPHAWGHKEMDTHIHTSRI